MTWKRKEGDGFRGRGKRSGKQRSWHDSIGFIGFGRLGCALAKGLRTAGWPRQRITAYSTAYAEATAGLGIRKAKSLAGLAKASDILLVAVKPKDLGNVLTELKAVGVNGKIVVSLAAGWPLKKLEGTLGKARIARAMPNVNAAVCESVTALCFNDACTKSDRQSVKQVFDAVGQTMELEDRRFDAFTYASGCGPATVAYLAQGLEKAFAGMGFPRALAKKIACKLLSGTGNAMEQGGLSCDELIALVKTKGGYTEKLLEALEREGVAGRVAKTYKKVNR